MDFADGAEHPRIVPRVAETRQVEAQDNCMDDIIRSLASNPARERRKVTVGSTAYKITVPGDWVGVRDKTPGIPGRVLTEFHQAGKTEPQISVFYRGQPEDKESGDKFHQLLAANRDLKVPKVLTPAQIGALSATLGYVVGDNQYRPSPNPLAGPPKFQLSSATLMPLNGKTVLAAEGAVLDRSGKPVSYISEIFIDSDGTGRNVHEVFLQADNREEFDKNRPAFQTAIHSLEWK